MSRITTNQLAEMIAAQNENINVLAKSIDKLATRLDNLEGKAPKARSKKGATKSNDFDRDLYIKTAKKLGVLKTKEYVNEKDRAAVYKAMGYTK